MKKNFTSSDIFTIIFAILTTAVSFITISSEFKNIASQMLSNELFLSIFTSIIGGVIAVLLTFAFYRLNRRSPSLRIFISHKHQDENPADNLAANLRKNGYIIFDPNTMIKAGEKITEKTEDIIKSSDLVLFILSRPEATSEWTQKELDIALKHNRAIVPLSIQQDPELPESIRDIKYLVLNNENLEKTMPTLIQAVEAHRN